MANFLEEHIKSFETGIRNWDEDRYYENIELILDESCKLKNLSNSDYVEVGRLWKFISYYYANQITRVLYEAHDQKMFITHVYKLNKKDAKLYAQNIIDKRKEYNGGTEYGP